jgi:tetratricopeptide (TPR) repeat protein
LFGVAPFAGRAPLEILHNLDESGPRTPPSTTKVPRRIQQAVLRGLARDPDDRHASMDVLIDVLESALRVQRGRLLVAGTAAVITAGAIAFAVHGGADPCVQVGAPMAEAWNAVRKAEVAQALGGVDVPYAADATASVEQRIDAYASAWVDERTAACRQAHDGAQGGQVPLDQRIACLERGREHVAAIVEVLLDADESVAAAAVTLADTAEDPRRCGRPHSEADREGTDVRGWAEVERVRSQIARGRARTAAARTAEAATILEQALRDAREIGSPLLEAEALIRLGSAYSDAGDDAHAVAVLESALERSITIGADDLAAEAVSRLLMYDGQSLDNVERGRVWEVQARGWLERFADDPNLRTQLAVSLAMFESADGRYPDAIARLAAVEQDVADIPTRRFTWLLNRGAVYLKAEQHQNAIAVLQEAVALGREIFGEGHPSVATAQSRLATQLGVLGRLDEAEALHMEALAVRRRHGTRVDVAESLSDLGVVLTNAQDYDRAIEVTEEARDILQREAPLHGYLAAVRNNLGVLYWHVGRNEEALAEIEAALQFRRERGHGGDALVVPLAAAARTQAEIGDVEQALATIAEADRYARTLPSPNVLRAKVQWVKAEIIAIDGRKQEAFDTMVLAIKELEGADAAPSEWFDALAELGEMAMALR